MHRQWLYMHTALMLHPPFPYALKPSLTSAGRKREKVRRASRVGQDAPDSAEQRQADAVMPRTQYDRQADASDLRVPFRR